MKKQFDSCFYKQIIDKIQANIYITDVETDEIVYMNEFMKKTFHLSEPEGKICWQVFQENAKGRCQLCKVEELMKCADKKECVWREHNPVTGRFYLNVDILEEWNGKTYHIQYGTDITDNLQLSIDAVTDELTTLLNRKAGRQRLDTMLKELGEQEQLIVALYDINGLKWVNDTFGHHEGDRLLHYVATYMKQELDGEDFMFRLSGDEFIVVFRNKEIYQADHWMKKMLEFLHSEKSDAGLEYEVSFSYGLVRINGRDHLTVSDALALADTQMYIQKRDYHIQQQQKRLQNGEQKVFTERKEFEYNREYLFDAVSESIDGYAYIGNLKTGEFLYSYKMVWDFGLPGPVLKEAAAFWGERIHPDDREFFLRSNQEVADGKVERHAITYRARNAKGQWVNLLCKGKMVRDENGVPDTFAGVIRNLDDVASMRNLSASATSTFYFMKEESKEEQMELQNHLLEFVNCHIPGGVLATYDDGDFTMIAFNQSLLTYLSETTYTDFLQQTDGKFIKFICEEDRERVAKEIRSQLKEKEMYEIYYRIRRGDGKQFWVYDVGRYALNTKGERFILSFLLDVTEEKENGAELDFINKNSTSGIFKVYLGAQIELAYANDAYYRIFGCTKEEMDSTIKDQLDLLVTQEEKKRIQKQIKEAILNGESQLMSEFQIRRNDGSKCWIHLNAGIMRQENGQYVMSGIAMDITERHELEVSLYHTEQMYQFIQDYTKLKVWEYDIDSDTVELHRIQKNNRKKSKKVLHYWENMLQLGKIHPNSIEVVKNVLARLKSGEEKVVSDICFVPEDKDLYWKRVTYIPQRDADGQVRRAIGISEDVTAQKEAELRAFNQEKVKEMLCQGTLYSVHMNLTAGRLEMAWSERSQVEFKNRENVSYTDVYEKIRSTIASDDDKKRFDKDFSPEKMKEYASRNNFTREFEFRQIYKEGKIIWVGMSVKIIASPTTGNKILFLYARNIDVAKRRELSLQKKAEIDETTGLYNLGTTKLLLEDMLNNQEKEATEKIFLLINVDNFKEVNHIGGFTIGDELLRQIGETLVHHLPPSAVAGRLNGDTFAVYLQLHETKNQMRRRADELTKALCRTYICGQRKFNITVSVGAFCPGERKISYDSLYQSAYQALDVAKRSGGNELIFYSSLVAEEAEHGVQEQEFAALFRKVQDWMERGESKKEVQRLLLEYVGKSCSAEEVTLLVRENNDKKLCHQVGWRAYQRVTKMIPKENYELFDTVLAKTGKKGIVYIEGEKSPGYEEALQLYGTDCLEYPICIMGDYEEGSLKYVILVEKCDSRIEGMQLRDIVMQMLRWTEYAYHLRRAYKHALENDRNTGVRNYESYEKWIEEMNEDTLITLGMVGVQIVDLKKYNQQYGTGKGDEILVFTADLMAKVFGRDNCYRVGRTRFLAVCENTTYAEFIRRYENFCGEIDQNDSEWIATANAWENASISIKMIQDQVEEKLLVAQNTKKNKTIVSEKAVRSIFENIQSQITDGSFCAYLQPKADVKTGKICGAEALIRLYDKDKGIIPPGSFLPAIERAGMIRYIDLFVLESVCRLLKDWIEEGWKPFPISLNYSRATILEPDILWETNRIVEAYGIAKELIEIEITESISSIDNVSFKAIVEQFTDCGYQIALDDYGAEYSNVYVLYSLNLSTLKLDRRIINDIYHNEKAKTVVENVISICRKFDIKCVAEGVETKEHLDVLRAMSCDMIQGYYINKPLSQEEFYQKYIRK